MIHTVDQLNWQKLEHCRDTSCLHLHAFQDFASPSSCSYLLYDIPALAPITTTRSSHERNLSVSMQEQT